MTESGIQVGVFVLARNEAKNIARCLSSMAASGWDVHLLDSGSTDGTQQLAATYRNVSLHDYTYVDHCTSYNDIITRFAQTYQVVLILDADMVVSADLQREVKGMLGGVGNAWDALRAPVEMWVEAHPLTNGSLCPSKPFVFATGKPLFRSTGHAEQPMDGVQVRELKSVLRHDDRKNYTAFLQSQARYAAKLIERYRSGHVTTRDSIRVRTPLLAIVVPLVSLFIKRGCMAGRTGLLYALDRLISEAIMYRYGLAMRLAHKKAKNP